MLLAIPSLLANDDALALGRKLRAADWIDGNVTSGDAAAQAKRNRQLPEASDAAGAGRLIVQRALAASPLFLSAALPACIYPPLFNRYGVGDGFAPHIDNAIRVDSARGTQMRTDLSATLFLSDPADYDGGVLTIEGSFGAIDYKLQAGDLLLYPATSLHRVTQITRGERIASFFWVQSLVRDGAAREMLFDLDQSVQGLSGERGSTDRQVLTLTRLYHNLIRRWSG
jgi:PKHD-type hydroxylase